MKRNVIKKIKSQNHSLTRDMNMIMMLKNVQVNRQHVYDI